MLSIIAACNSHIFMPVTFVGLLCHKKMVLCHAFESNTSNILIKYNYVTSVMVKYKYDLHSV